MTTYKRGNTWYVDFRFRKRRYRMKSPDNSRAGAATYEANLRQRLAHGENIEVVPEQKPKLLFKDFAERWFETYVKNNNKHSEVRNKRTLINANLLPFFGRLTIETITAQNIEEYKSVKIKCGLKNKSINNHLSCLRKCLNTAHEWGLVEQVPLIKLLKVPPPETFFLSPAECDVLMSVADDVWRDRILLMLRTGLRFGELAALKWMDVDFERKILTIQRAIAKGKEGSTKGNNIRRIPLSPDALIVLANRRRGHQYQYVFMSETGGPLRYETCRLHIRALAEQAGLRAIGWHTLRHTFASHLANNGIAIQVIQALLGHSDLKTTMRYAHLASSTLTEAIQALPMYSGQVWSQGGHKTHLQTGAAAAESALSTF